MPPIAARLLASAATAAILFASVHSLAAQQAQPASPPQPPHAWLFGAWTGGIFPAPSALSAQACLSQPVVIFTRDVILRATLTSELYIQRVIESARASASGAEFRLATEPGQVAGPLGITSAPAAIGFGCDGPDVLNVQRHTDNEISFPGCTDFPYPLVRCPAR
jgi:hypothetical protein